MNKTFIYLNDWHLCRDKNDNPNTQTGNHMYLIIGLIGVALGAYRAKKLNGNRADILQYAAGFGILFAVLALVATILLDRTVI